MNKSHIIAQIDLPAHAKSPCAVDYNEIIKLLSNARDALDHTLHLVLSRERIAVQRHANQKLIDVLFDLLKWHYESMSVAELAHAALEGGYITKAKNFKGCVRKTLQRSSINFKQIYDGTWGLTDESYYGEEEKTT